jgi:GNAT superfamily N-acetyltransferase
MPFEAAHIDEAVSLFASSYSRERLANPILPGRAMEDRAWIASSISSSAAFGASAFLDGELQGYMAAIGPFNWKGQKCSMIREFCHASAEGKTRHVYQLLYMTVAGQLAAEGVTIHLIGHFWNDAMLRDTLFELGFGAIVCEEIRDLTPIPTGDGPRIRQENDPSAILDLITEHARYYQKSPIFIPKQFNSDSVPMPGNALFVHRENGKPDAYCIVGPCPGEEGFLLQGTNTAQLLTEYSKPEARGKGVGKALLNASILWAREAGFDRLMVDHESANIPGGNFWRRHFSPYLAFSMRYIDPAGLREPGSGD